MPRANTVAIRISDELVNALRPEAIKSGRSIPMEIEHRLRQSLEAVGDDRMPPWARAVGSHMAYLASGAADTSQSADEALADMKARAAGYFDGLLKAFRIVLGDKEVNQVEADVRDDATAAGNAFARKILSAHEPDSRRGAEPGWREVAQPTRVPSSDQLLTDQRVLFVSADALAKLAASMTPTRPRKGKR